MMMETDSSPTSKTREPKLRWFQYSLRSLFALTFLVAIGMSYIAVTIQDSAEAEGAAAKAVEKAGGTVECKRSWLGTLSTG